MSKEELYILCKQKGNVYCIEKYFSSHFPDFYFELNQWEFPFDFKFSQKLYHYFNNDPDLKLGLCPVCNNRCTFVNINIGYQKHCSIKCLGMDDIIKTQRKKSCLDKYGVDNYSKTQECKEKVKNTNKRIFGKDYYQQTNEYKDRVKITCQEKYNNDTYFGSDDCKKKTKQTCLDKYGSTSYTKTQECQDKIRKTTREKYGVNRYSQTDECKQKVKESFQNHYGVDRYSQTEYWRNDIKEICQEKYGVDHYSQTDEYKEKMKNTCQKRYGVDHYFQTDDFKKRTKQTCLERYGVENYTQTDEYKKKSKRTNLEKYGVENYSQTDECKEKMRQTCLERYGVESFSQTNDFAKYHRKQIEYDGITFDSSWEVIVYKYCKENNIFCEYQPDITFEYEYDGKKHYYHPDFLINGKLYEVKGEQFFEGDKMINPYDRTQDGLYEAKHQCMIKNNIIILKENDIKIASYTK